MHINLALSSAALLLLFVWALLWILMDVHFCNFTRRQKWLFPLLLALVVVFNQGLHLWLEPTVYAKIFFLTMHVPYFLIFLCMTKCGVIKMAFMIFSAVIFTAPSVFAANIARRNFGDTSLTLFLANLITYAIMLLLAQFVFRKGFNYVIKYADDRFIVHSSFVPLLYYIYLFASADLDFSAFHSVRGLPVRLLPTIYVFVFYFLLFRNFKEFDEKRELETVQAALSQQLDAAKDQIAFLNETQTQTAVYQHNMRHHLNVIDSFLAAGKFQHAEEYIRSVQADVEAITPKRFCENEIVNLLCSSFSGKAERMGICLNIEAKLPKVLSVSDTELCSVLSNGLENALHAVTALGADQKWVEFYCGVRLNKILIEIKNPYAGEVIMRDGLPVSDQEGHGYGCRSIRTIAQHHQGHCTFEAAGGIFVLRAVLPLT